MKLAKAAPKVGAAVAEKAPKTEAATASAPGDAEPAPVERAPRVEPATAESNSLPTNEVLPSPGDAVSVSVLRGGAGADFEGKAAVLRGAPKKTFLKKALPLLFDERDFVSYGEVARYVLIKGNCIFVFAEDTDVAPLYAIPLEDVTAVLEDPKKPDPASVTISPTAAGNKAKDRMKTILLKFRKTGKQAYQITFDEQEDNTLGSRFYKAIEMAPNSKTVTASVLRANETGKKAAKAQPKH